MAKIVRDSEAFSTTELKSFLVPRESGIIPSDLNAKKNLLDDLDDITLPPPPPPSRESLRVFLRVKPKTAEEEEFSKYDKNSATVSIESLYQIALKAPIESHTFKAGRLTHRYSFTKIFSPTIQQEELFREVVLPRVKDFLVGKSQLLFTYGATSSGKTFTIQGTLDHPGIVPRTLDTIFNSIEGQISSSITVKPLTFNRVVALKDDDVERITHEKSELLNSGYSGSADSSKSSAISHMTDDSEFSIPAMDAIFSRVRDENKVHVGHSGGDYTVWVSFAEIYNENIYDLLEIHSDKKGERKKRIPLRLAEDRSGATYIKELKEFPVSSADEAYQVLMMGRRNLQFAATRLNPNSSRSHCIFTIKVVRGADNAESSRITILSFCDLAGSERVKKTRNDGQRLREAGNINASLLVLGRCIKILRANQEIKEPKRHQIIPYRDSKLTRLFQTYFAGRGKVSMIVNISQSPFLFDESLQVLRFAAIASKITVTEEELPKPKRHLNKRMSRFLSIVEVHKSKESLAGRGSIAWENPSIRSTILEEKEDEENDDVEMTRAADTTVVETQYEGLLKLIDSLKNDLIAEKQKNLTLEQEVRSELCDEFSKLLAETESNCEKRLQDEKDRILELSEWRQNKLREAIKSKRSSLASVQEEECDELNAKIAEKDSQIEQLENKIVAMKETYINDIKDLKELLDEASEEYLQKEKEVGEVQEAKKQMEKKHMTESCRMEQELNDEIENLRASKKLLKMKVEEQSKALEAKEDEIGNLEKEIKSMFEAQRVKKEEMVLEEEQKKGTEKDLEAMKAKNAELESVIENLKCQVDMYKKEENALAVLKGELDLKNSERLALQERVTDLQAKLNEKEYDINKAKEEKELLMQHYDQQIRKKAEELSREKHESLQLRDVLSKSTPQKKKLSENEREIQVLRDELQRKTELIKQLEEKMTTPKINRIKSCKEEPKTPMEEPESDTEDMKKELEDLKSELAKVKAAHAKETTRIKRANEKIIREYKDTNLKLQRRIAEQSTDFVDTTVDETPGSSRRSKRAKTGESDENDDSEAMSPPQKRASRLTRSRPVRKKKKGEEMKTPVLREHNSTVESLGSKSTRKQLYSNTFDPKVFTPPSDVGTPLPAVPETPCSIVKRQLRTRKSKK